MRIGILTFHCAANYGAVLQAYGLQEALKSLGHNVCILDYKPEYLTRPYRSWLYREKATLPEKVKEFCRALLVFHTRYKRNRLFARFIKDNLLIRPYDNIADMEAVITGSDQVWNPVITAGTFDPVFLLKDARKDQIKMSYAASAGSTSGLGEYINKENRNLLQRFDSISVREQQLYGFLETQGIKADSVVLDPTLLAGAETFDGLTDRILAPRKPYLLLFTLCHDKRARELAVKIAHKKGLRLIEMISMDESPLSKEIIATASVTRFLSLIRFADFVVTGSFHGTAFSLLFNRPFVSVSSDMSAGQRAASLLKSIGLGERFILLNDIEKMPESDIDYTEANKMFNELRQKSYLAINQTITPPHKYYLIIGRTYAAPDPLEGIAA